MGISARSKPQQPDLPARQPTGDQGLREELTALRQTVREQQAALSASHRLESVLQQIASKPEGKVLKKIVVTRRNHEGFADEHELIWE